MNSDDQRNGRGYPGQSHLGRGHHANIFQGPNLPGPDLQEPNLPRTAETSSHPIPTKGIFRAKEIVTGSL